MGVEYDDDARDIRALLENTQAWLSLVKDEEMSITDKLLVASININVALTIAIGRQTGVLQPQTTDIEPPAERKPPMVYATWAANNRMSERDLRSTLAIATANVGPDWRNLKIQLIKEIRAITGLGLKESKDLADLATPDPNEWWRTP